ncbi:MAG: hypothetical protein NC078_04085 [Ruminococcus sp.]|nr:hypothetical protein [Ruminococcus sp.]
MNKCKWICLSIVIGFSVLGILGSAIIFFVDIPESVIGIISTWIGIMGTTFSVVLSIMAMHYSNKSSKDAEESLRKITNHYEALCTELKNKEIQESLGVESINRVILNNKSKINDNSTK